MKWTRITPKHGDIRIKKQFAYLPIRVTKMVDGRTVKSYYWLTTIYIKEIFDCWDTGWCIDDISETPFPEENCKP